MAHPLPLAALLAAVVASSASTFAAPAATIKADAHLRVTVLAALDSDLSTVRQSGDDASLNPQPLPPKYRKKLIRLLGEELMLNPQPLPPRLLFPGIPQAHD